MQDRTVISTLQQLERQRGTLKPIDVVEAARDPESPLHDYFEWQDSKAAEKYRLWQARILLRVTVQYVGLAEDQSLTRVFVSLKSDRIGKDGGYRSLVRVMSNATLKAQLFDDALQDMRHFQERYKELRELEDVFVAMRRAERGSSRKASAKRN